MTDTRPTAPFPPQNRASRRRARGRLLVSLYAVLCLAVAGMIIAHFWPREAAPPARPAQHGKVVLTLKNEGRTVTFDMGTLEALPQTTLKVRTPWYRREVSFQGPLLRDVLAAAQAAGTYVAASATNDFTAEIDFSDIHDYDVIIALAMDGRPMSPRDRGPLFLIYPYEDLPSWEMEYYYNRSVWQLDRLMVW